MKSLLKMAVLAASVAAMPIAAHAQAAAAPAVAPGSSPNVAVFDMERAIADSAATTPYCGGFTSAVARGAVFGVQFHPEKSQRAGFAVLRNFLSI
jgi:hypothetical protein